MLAQLEAPAKSRLNAIRRVGVFFLVFSLWRVHVYQLAADEEADKGGNVGDAVLHEARGRGGRLGEGALKEGEGCYGAVGVAGWEHQPCVSRGGGKGWGGGNTVGFMLGALAHSAVVGLSCQYSLEAQAKRERTCARRICLTSPSTSISSTHASSPSLTSPLRHHRIHAAR